MPTPLTNLYPGFSIDNPAAADIGPYLPGAFSMKRHTYWFDDFNTYTLTDLAAATLAAKGWVLTETQAGATELQTTGHGGQLLITNTSADNDVASMQLGGLGFTFAAGRKAWMGFRVKASEATDFEVMLGLSVVDTSPIQSLPSECAVFYKADDAATWQFLTRSGSATLNNNAAIATMVANTYQVLEMYYDGGNSLQVFVDGAQTGSTSAAFASLFPTVDMQVTLAVQAGAAAAKTCTIDYGYVAMERA